MIHSYVSRFLLAMSCVVLTACGGGDGSTSESMVGPSTGMMAKASLSTTTYKSESMTAAIDWTPCAVEGGTCTFPGQAQVRYGTATTFVVKTLTSPVKCSNAVFGDPAVNQAKSCSIEVLPVWTVCATEGGTCAADGSNEIRYGTDTNYVAKRITGSVACTNATFGDPAPNIVKSCKIASSASTNAATSNWAECAVEGKICAQSGTYQVRYGTATQFFTNTVTGPVACTNTTFGDPAPGLVKSCKVIASNGSDMPASGALVSVSPSTSVAVPVPVSIPGAITTVQLINPGSTAYNNAVSSFGQVFAQGDVPQGSTLIGKLSNGSTVPLQVDAKARHADGSLRHAVITVQLPSLAANQAETVGLVRDTLGSSAVPASPATLLSSGFNASFNATINGVRYSTAVEDLLQSGKYTTWLAGALATEWIVAAPLKTTSGTEHPHLHARFAIRFYSANNSARVDVTIENGWAFAANPSNFTYDAQVLVGGQQVFAQAGLTHYSHARWRKVFWWGNASKLDVRHNTAYLIASKAVPNYDQSLVISESAISTWKSHWTKANKGPMQAGVAVPYMPTTGARADIGPMPTWSAIYLLSMNQQIKDLALGMSDAAGSWSAHYRDKNTGRPVTLASYPYLSRYVSGSVNPATKKSEALPDCPAALCSTPLTADVAHQPAFSYVPYLVTGDYYHLEELQFWASFNSFYTPPQYRENGKGLMANHQVRGQAWGLRTLAEAAYITPDNDPQKATLTAMLNHNIDYYNNTYTNNPAANKLGVVTNGYSLEYDNKTGLAPWQDDFVTAMFGHIVELGFTNAKPFLAWKSKFVVERMTGTGYCWIQGAAYSLKVRDSVTAPFYDTIGQAYKASNASISDLTCGSANMANALKLRVGEMAGGLSPGGQQAIMQPALSYAVNTHSGGANAWVLFMARSYKPQFSVEPQYAILPR